MPHTAWYSKLSEDEEAKVKELEAAVAETVGASASHRAFCSTATYVRYLRARKWNLQKAVKMLQATLAWRGSYRPDHIEWDAVKHEAGSGKLFILDDPDPQGRPVVLMRPRKDTSSDSESRVRWVVYTLERASALADHAVDGKMAWLIDFVGYSRRNAPPISVALQTLHILQDHYPERLGKAVCFQPPMVFELLYKAVYPFIDPVTKEKVIFVTKKAPADAMSQYFHMTSLDSSLGGSIPEDEVFTMESYGLRMKKMDADCLAKRIALEDAQDDGPPAAAKA